MTDLLPVELDPAVIEQLGRELDAVYDETIADWARATSATSAGGSAPSAAWPSALASPWWEALTCADEG